MKRITKYLLIFVFVLSVFTLAACGKVKVTDITIENPAISLEEEATEQIVYTVLPEDATDKTVTFASANPEIATVSETGLVTGVAAGSTKITVTSGKIEKEVDVTVVEKGPEPLTISAALALDDLADVTLKGQVIGIQGTQAWLADTEAGISLYNVPEADLAKIVVGNVIVVTGKRADYSGTKQIGDITEIKVVETDKPAIASINLADLSETKLNESNQRLIKGSFEITQVPTTIEYNEDGSLKNHLTYKMTDGTNEVIFYVKKYLSAAAVTSMKTVLDSIELGGKITFDKAVVGWYKSVPQVLVINETVLSYEAPTIVEVTGVEVTNKTVKVDQESTEQIIYEVLPANATDKTVTFTSADDTIATVSETGLITGVAVGETTISVKAKTFEQIVTVTVTEKPLTIAEVLAVDDETEVLFKGQVIGIQGTQAWLADGEAGVSLYSIPSEHMDKIVVGNVIVVAGQRSDYSGTKQISSITSIEVRETGQSQLDSIDLADLEADTLNNTLQQLIGGSFEVTAVPNAVEYNEDGSLKNHLTYKISDGTNEVVFYVKKYLSIEAVTSMKDVLDSIELGGTLTFDNAVVGWYKSVPQVLVINETSISFVAPADPTSVVITNVDEFVINVPKQLEAIAIPVGKVVNYEWSVDNEAIATISESGELTFIAPGEVVVTVKIVEFPTLTASKTFTLVAPDPTDITIEGDSKVIIHEGQTYQYIATVNPAGALQTVTWSVNDVTKATVDEFGVLTPIAEGSVQLTATSTINEAITRIKFVQIENYIEPNVVIEGSPMVSVGIPTPFKATVESNFLSKKVVWSISDETIATISEDGILTGLVEGTVTVTATSEDDPLVKSTFEVEVIVISHANIVIDATINDETPFELTYDEVVYYKGINAFAEFSDAAALIQDGAIIYVLPGEYIKKASFNASNIQIIGPNAGINPVTDLGSRTDEANVQAELSFGTKTNKLSNVVIDGLKFTGSGYIYAPYGIDDLTVQNVWFTAPNIDAAKGMIYAAAPTIDVTSKNIIVQNSVLDDSNFLGYRGIRLNNTENITIIDNYFYQFYDAIRLECTGNGGFNVAPNGIGAAGTVLISGNEFDMNRQYPIILTVVSATKVDVIHNTVLTDVAFGGSWGQVYMSNIVPTDGVKTVINIKYNTFENFNNYHSVRIKSNGLTAENLEYNVNFNKWLAQNNIYEEAGEMVHESYVYCSMAEGDVDLVTNAANNYFAVAPEAIDFTNVNTFEPYFTDLEAFEYAKGVDLGEIDPLELHLFLESNQIQAGKTAQLTSNLEGTTYVSSNTDVATIDASGLITGVTEGEAVITATNGEKTATVTVTIIMGYDPLNMMVDPAWATEVEGTMITVNELEYIVGLNGFATLADAVENAIDNSTILVMAGEYDGGFDIVKSGVSIIAPNAETNPVLDETPFLKASETAVHINTEFYVNASNVTIKGISMTGDVRLRGFTQISNFHFENNYVYETYAATVAWKELTYGIDSSSTGEVTPGVINFAGNYTWAQNFEFINNKFYNVDDTNVFLGFADSATFIGNHFEGFGRDAVRFDYGQNKGVFVLDNNEFINGKLNAIFFRGYTSSIAPGEISVTVSNNTFDSVGLNPDEIVTTSIAFAGLAIRNHQEKADAVFNIFKNDFVDCPVALSLRNNYASSMPYELEIYVSYNSFINEVAPAFYHKNQFGGDSNTSNPADAVFKHNYYGSSETVAVVPTASQFNNAVVEHENDFATYADLAAERPNVELYGKLITSLEITKYDGVDWSGLLVVLDPDGDKGAYWYNIILRETTTEGLYEIVAIGVGAVFNAETDDYCIGIHDENPLYSSFVASGLEVGHIVTFPGTDLSTLSPGAISVMANFYGEVAEDLPPVLELTIENTEIEAGTNGQLVANIEGTTYESSDISIATVDEFGVVTGISSGEVTITATNGEQTATITITIFEVIVPLNLLVDPAMVLANDEVFTFDGIEYKVGETAFALLSDALAILNEGYTITLREGLYDQAFAISLNDVTLKGAVNETAIITNKVTISGANGLTISNLAFTELGQIYGTGALDNFTFENNNVYASTIVASAFSPNNRVDVNAFIQLYSGTGSNLLGNVTIANNVFDGMSSDIINLDRTSIGKEINILDNQFRNFAIGAIRFDGGYNNGTYNILRNIFVNDELGAFAGIVFRAYSASADQTQVINIEENLFMNIGDLSYDDENDESYPRTAVITTSTFNDKNVTMNILNNEFVNNINDLHLRNSGALATNWLTTINYNEFRGTQGYVYYETVDLADLNHNYFEDTVGNPITDPAILATLIKTNTNYATLKEKAVVEAGNLFFSEYTEGGSYNKAIEIYNNSGKYVDLTGYIIESYANGKTTIGATIVLEGILAAGDTFVIAHTSAADELKNKADLLSGSLSHNGDDDYLLKFGDELLDAFGQIGFDPGTGYGTDPSTADMTWVRKSSITTGDKISDDVFDPNVEWVPTSYEDFSGFGSHTIDSID
ncbi:MAG: Ig-like domain-containing protein [Bacilli bacterium]|nr:Ig-like domain-containing protein [Bacilli bacterium]